MTYAAWNFLEYSFHVGYWLGHIFLIPRYIFQLFLHYDDTICGCSPFPIPVVTSIASNEFSDLLAWLIRMYGALNLYVNIWKPHRVGE